MACFSCFSSHELRSLRKWSMSSRKSSQSSNSKVLTSPADASEGDNNVAAESLTFRELAKATKNFKQESLIGEGGFGRVYKGTLSKSGRVVAVKQLDKAGDQGNEEFIAEVLMLSQLQHRNLVNLIGYCADGDQRLLVCDYLQMGSLQDHLFDLPPQRTPLPWATRMSIALGVAKGLDYLHNKASPPVIYRDLKCSNILLEDDHSVKLSDFGLAKRGAAGDDQHVSTRAMGTYGYCAPEYEKTGHVTVKSDVYSFGVVMLELISGRRVVDLMRMSKEQSLVMWAQPIFRDQSRFKELADPVLEGSFPEKGLNQAVAVAAMCLQEEAEVRPLITDVVHALNFVAAESDDAPVKKSDEEF